MNKRFYLTTPIYYVNDAPHVGHTYSTVAADILARYHRAVGDDTFFLVGTDENAKKNEEKAAQLEEDTQSYVTRLSDQWEATWKELGISYDRFIRTTQEYHQNGVYEFVKRVKQNGDIYKGQYKGLYCLGCEDFITEKDLTTDGLCPSHNKPPQEIVEDNYFFRLSAYRDKLLAYYNDNPEFIMPSARRNEIISLVENHCVDFSVSRQNLTWGIPFPDDPDHRIYVWFDALINYLTGVGFGWDEDQFKKYWPADLHIVGKDIIKFHCIYWPAMLMSAGFELPKQIFAHGYFTTDGKKISKSLGNAISPLEIATEFGMDTLRYYLFSEMTFGQDGDFSRERLTDLYNAKLANGLGNLAGRLAKLAERCNLNLEKYNFDLAQAPEEYHAAMRELRFQDALGVVEDKIRALDKTISEEKIWELSDDLLAKRLEVLILQLREVITLIGPFLPTSAEVLERHFGGESISALAPLFPRIKK